MWSNASEGGVTQQMAGWHREAPLSAAEQAQISAMGCPSPALRSAWADGWAAAQDKFTSPELCVVLARALPVSKCLSAQVVRQALLFCSKDVGKITR